MGVIGSAGPSGLKVNTLGHQFMSGSDPDINLVMRNQTANRVVSGPVMVLSLTAAHVYLVSL